VPVARQQLTNLRGSVPRPLDAVLPAEPITVAALLASSIRVAPARPPSTNR
jgi:hypothetical protein